MSYQYSSKGEPTLSEFCTVTRSVFALHVTTTRVGCVANTKGRLTPAPYMPIGSPTRALKSMMRMPSVELNASPFGVVEMHNAVAVPVATFKALTASVLNAESPVTWNTLVDLNTISDWIMPPSWLARGRPAIAVNCTLSP